MTYRVDVVEKQSALIKKVYERTEAGMLAWTERIGGEGYSISFPEYSININALSGSRGTSYWVDIVNHEGKVIESFSDKSLSEAAWDEDYSDLMRNLYTLARRQALGADEALDDLLEKLGAD